MRVTDRAKVGKEEVDQMSLHHPSYATGAIRHDRLTSQNRKPLRDLLKHLQAFLELSVWRIGHHGVLVFRSHTTSH